MVLLKKCIIFALYNRAWGVGLFIVKVGSLLLCQVVCVQDGKSLLKYFHMSVQGFTSEQLHKLIQGLQND